MWVLIRNDFKIEARHFKHKFIRCYLYILINKFKGNEVRTLIE